MKNQAKSRMNDVSPSKQDLNKKTNLDMIKSLVRTIEGVIGRGKQRKSHGQQKLKDHRISHARFENSNNSDDFVRSAMVKQRKTLENLNPRVLCRSAEPVRTNYWVRN